MEVLAASFELDLLMQGTHFSLSEQHLFHLHLPQEIAT
jgi:hypothetical protein